MATVRDVPRQIFLLPSSCPGGPVKTQCCRKVRRRAERSFHQRELVEERICALNALYSGERIGVAKSASVCFLAESEVFKRIVNSVQALGPPPGDLTSGGALQQLHAFDGYGEDQTPSTVRPYEPHLLSLPTAGSNAVPLEELLGDRGGEIVGEFIRSKLLPEVEARKRIRQSGLRQVYSDPRLKDHCTYRKFVERLIDADIVEVTLQPSVEQIEVFFVAKKDGRLRMVVDCRLPNLHFEAPEKVHLCAAESLTRVELPPESELVISTADLKDAFYHFGLPTQLRRYLGWT